MGPDLLILVLKDGLEYNDDYLWLKMENWTSTKTMHELLTTIWFCSLLQSNNFAIR